MNLEPLTLEEEPIIPSSKSEDKKRKKILGLWDRSYPKNKMKKPNNVAVVFLRNNGIAELLVLESKRGFFTINNKTYHERRDCTWITGKNRMPLCVIFENDMLPIGKKEWDDRELREKLAELQDHVLRGIRHAELVKMGEKDSSNINMKQVIIWGLVLLVGGIILFNYI